MTMKATAMAVSFLLCAALGSTPALSATVDIVPYMSLKPGQWAMVQSAASLDGYVASKGKHGQVVQTWYHNDGSNWVFDSSQVFSISSTELVLLEENDGVDRWVYEPSVVIPRPLTLGQPVFYSGVLKNSNTHETSASTLVFLVTMKGVAVDAPAGSFTDCIKNRLFTYGGGTSRDSVSLNCKGRQDVKSWYNKIKDTGIPQEEDQLQSSPSAMVQYGDSGAPFP
jgi:hypothetical protein